MHNVWLFLRRSLAKDLHTILLEDLGGLALARLVLIEAGI